MKHARQKKKVFLATVISFWVLFFYAYAHSYNLAEADFLGSSPHWEKPFLEGFLAGLKGKWEVFEGNEPSILFVPGEDLCGRLAPLSFQNLFSVKKAPTLRC